MTTNRQDIFVIGPIQLAPDANPESNSGAKAEVSYPSMRLSGSAVTLAKAMTGKGLRTAVFSAQSPLARDRVAFHLARLGAMPLIRERLESNGTRGVLMNGKGRGDSALLSRRPSLRAADFDPQALSLMRGAGVTVCGPLAEPGASNLIGGLRMLASLAARSVLIPHPNLLRHSGFPAVARCFGEIIVHDAEAVPLVPGCQTVGGAALHLRQIASQAAEAIVTSNTRPGLVWAQGKWHRINSLVGAAEAEASTAHYIEQRFLRTMDAAEVFGHVENLRALEEAADTSVTASSVTAAPGYVAKAQDIVRSLVARISSNLLPGRHTVELTQQ